MFDSSKLGDAEFIVFCQKQSRTPGGWFKGYEYNRMLALSGNPLRLCHVLDDAWISASNSMSVMCDTLNTKQARTRHRPRMTLVVNNTKE